MPLPSIATVRLGLKKKETGELGEIRTQKKKGLQQQAQGEA